MAGGGGGEANSIHFLYKVLGKKRSVQKNLFENSYLKLYPPPPTPIETPPIWQQSMFYLILCNSYLLPWKPLSQTPIFLGVKGAYEDFISSYQFIIFHSKQTNKSLLQRTLSGQIRLWEPGGGGGGTVSLKVTTRC